MHIIISPLTALATEQAEGLSKRGIKSLYLHSADKDAIAELLSIYSKNFIILKFSKRNIATLLSP
jgi:superfamily II DNA helicase RecQ